MTSNRPRFIIVGAGAIGGSLAAELALSGQAPVLVGRGEHGGKIAQEGLHYLTPRDDRHIQLSCVPALSEVSIATDDVVVLAMKLGDVADAAAQVATTTTTVPTLCLQNGVAGERIASEHLEHVYGGMVYLPATYLEPGRVENFCSNGPGAIRIGSYKGGSLAHSESIAEQFGEAGFNSAAVADIMPWKYGKLLTNLANAIGVVCSDRRNAGELNRAAIVEAEACYRAANIAFLSSEELVEEANIRIAPIAGKRRLGGSMWQSVARGRPPEVAYLNGEIVELGKGHAVPTPINSMLVSAVLETVAKGVQWTAAQLQQRAKVG